MLERALPEIDAYEEGEMRIPPTCLATFNRHFVDGDLRPEFEYVYRTDVVLSGRGGIITEWLCSYGHQCINRLIGWPELKEGSPEFLREMYAYVSNANQVGKVARGLYFYCGWDAARRLQARSLTFSPEFVVCENGEVRDLGDPEELLRAVSIVSRVSRRNLPEGSFFPDPNMFETPKAVVHIVTIEVNSHASIPPKNIEIFIDGEWKNLLQADLKQVVREARAGEIRRILTF